MGMGLRCVGRFGGAREASALATEGRLEQILDNLIENAISATPAGGDVRIVASSDEDQAEIRVVDHGRGLTAEQRARAFDRFWQADAATGGSGLGLSIVDRLASADGGDAHLEETPGGGITAIVRLAPAGALERTAVL